MLKMARNNLSKNFLYVLRKKGEHRSKLKTNLIILKIVNTREDIKKDQGK
jgi:hypothetical protein